MLASRIKLYLGLTAVFLFLMAGPFQRSGLWHGSASSLVPSIFTFFAAPAQQATSYPPADTQEATQGYPEPPTATTGSGYPGPQTATPRPVSSSTPSLNQTVTTLPPLVPTVTPSQTSTAGKDIFLTENAEMGQSQATPLPTETPSPSATLTATSTPTQTATTIPPDPGFTMDWSVFLIAFLGMILVGGAAWLAFLKRVLFRRA